jgi:SAM-dependent methyltransferase
MGLGPPEAEFLLAEHRYQPIRGTWLTISRQTVGMTPSFAKHLVTQAGVALRPEAQIHLDKQTTGHSLSGVELISDDSFYALFSDAKFSILDVSDYEGADVLHDMNLPIGAEWENRFDFVLCGSCLDNIFDPVTALQNLARLTKPGGRIFLFEWGNSFPTGYLRFTPDWFLDYFAVNGFADAKAYMLHFPGLDGMERHASDGAVIDVYHYDPLVEQSGQLTYQLPDPQSLRYTMNYVIAEKAADSTWDRFPTQADGRTDAERRVYVEAAVKFQKSPRPLFRRGGQRPVIGDPTLSRHGTLKPVASWVVGEAP